MHFECHHNDSYCIIVNDIMKKINNKIMKKTVPHGSDLCIVLVWFFYELLFESLKSNMQSCNDLHFWTLLQKSTYIILFFLFYEQFICEFLSIYRSQEKLVQNTDQQFFVPLCSESEFNNDGLGCLTIISLYSAFNRHKINCFGLKLTDWHTQFLGG